MDHPQDDIRMRHILGDTYPTHRSLRYTALITLE